MKRIVVIGANGNMGQTVIKMIAKSSDLKLVGAVDIQHVGINIHKILGIKAEKIILNDSLEDLLKSRSIN